MKKFLLIAVILLFITNIGDLRAASREEIKIGGDLGIGMPMGTFGDDFNMGFGINAVFSYFVNPQLIVTGTLGYWNYGVKNLPSGVSASFTSIPFNGGIQYRFNRGKFQPFVSAETLLFFNSFSASASGYGSSSESKTQFGFTPGFGAAFPLENDLEIRAALKYNIIFNSDANWNQGNSINSFCILAGIHFKI